MSIDGLNIVTSDKMAEVATASKQLNDAVKNLYDNTVEFVGMESRRGPDNLMALAISWCEVSARRLRKIAQLYQIPVGEEGKN